MPSGIDKKCIELSYRLLVPNAEFDVDRFAKALGVSDGWARGVTLGPKRVNPSSFHAHVYWRQAKDKPAHVQLQVDFHRWHSEKKTVASTPSADDFYVWAAEFLSIPIANVHVHAEFKFSMDSWRTKILPLPMKIPLGAKSAVVDGFSIEVASQPEGVDSAWIHLANKNVVVQLYAFRRMEFTSFAIGKDVEAFSSVMKNLVEDKRQ